jgi:CRISPR/Cas system-associated exonuclease Cas4 (RecB family)
MRKLIAELIDVEILDERMEQQKKWGPKKRFSASDLAKCKRQLWYAFRPDTPKAPPQAKKVRRFALGNLVESYHEEYLKKIGIPVISQSWIENGILSGRMDWIIEYDGEKIIVEVKSLSSYDTRPLEAAADKLAWVRKNKKNYLWQLLYYMYEKKYKKGLLHFIGLDGFATDVEINYDEMTDEIAEILKEIEVYSHLNLSEEPPRREFRRDSRKGQCGYCEYADYCWKDYAPDQNDDTDEDAEELVLEYLVNKEKETELTTKLKDLKAKIETKLFKQGKQELLTDIGGVRFQVKRSVSYKEDIDMLMEILEPKGLYGEIFEVSDSKIKELIKRGHITEAELEPAQTVTHQRSLVQVKP